MTKSAHQRTAFATPVDIIFMTSDTLFVKGRQQRDRDLLCQLFFVASGALAPLAHISVVEDIKIMVADPASKDALVYIMVKPHGRFMALAKFLAFKIHDPFIGLFILGPCRRCCKNESENQAENKIPMLHKSTLRLTYVNPIRIAKRDILP